MASFPAQNNLHGKWDLYFHLPNNSEWGLSSYSKIMESIDTVERVLELNTQISDKIVKNCMLFVMRNGITPMWEDKHNRDGGCFSYKVSNRFVPDVWKHLFFLLCGESLCVKKEDNQYVNGITISPKKNFCIIKIWLADSHIQDPDTITNINNLNKNGCLFKKHAPEF
jgi:hypothetical protein